MRMGRLSPLAVLLKKRDIARAYEAKEGNIAILAERFRASSTTVQDAIKRKAVEWQTLIDVFKASSGSGKRPIQLPWPRSWEYAGATLDPIYGDPANNIEAYAVQVEGQDAVSRVDGPSIVPAANMFGRDGWEVVHVKEKDNRFTFLLKRPVPVIARGNLTK